MWIHLRKPALTIPAAPAVPSNLYLLGLFLALNATDIVLTHVNVARGVAAEANPFLLLIIEYFGWAGLYGFKVFGPILLAVAILPIARIMTSRWFSYFLALICLVSLTGVCSGVYVSMVNWID